MRKRTVVVETSRTFKYYCVVADKVVDALEMIRRQVESARMHAVDLCPNNQEIDDRLGTLEDAAIRSVIHKAAAVISLEQNDGEARDDELDDYIRSIQEELAQNVVNESETLRAEAPDKAHFVVFEYDQLDVSDDIAHTLLQARDVAAELRRLTMSPSLSASYRASLIDELGSLTASLQSFVADRITFEALSDHLDEAETLIASINGKNHAMQRLYDRCLLAVACLQAQGVDQLSLPPLSEYDDEEQLKLKLEELVERLEKTL